MGDSFVFLREGKVKTMEIVLYDLLSYHLKSELPGIPFYLSLFISYILHGILISICFQIAFGIH